MVKDLQVGAWYVIAGQGPMKLELLDNPPAVLTLAFRKPEVGAISIRYWAGHEQVVRLVDRDYLETYRAGMKRAKLDTEGLEEINQWLWALNA